MAETENSDTRWLSAEEEHTWMALTKVLMYLPAALDAQLRRDAGIGHFDYIVMSALSMSQDRTLRMSELAGTVDASPSRLSHTFTRLEKNGWVTRTTAPDDARCNLATLTDAGWDKVVATAPGHVAAVREYVIDSLSAKQSQALREVCEQVAEAIGRE